MDVKEQSKIAEEFCKEHLVECCKELLLWKKTGLLKGENLRTLADLYSYADSYAMSLAEEQVKTFAMQLVCNTD